MSEMVDTDCAGEEKGRNERERAGNRMHRTHSTATSITQYTEHTPCHVLT